MPGEVPDELTDEQRALIKAHMAEHPASGFKSAIKAAGLLRVTKAQAKALIMADEDLKDAYLAPYSLNRHKVLTAIGEIVADPEHRDRLRAATWAGNVYHGLVEQKQVEHTGELTSNHQVAVSVSHDFKAIADTLEAAGVIRRGPVALRAAPEPVLPASADAEADGGADRAPLAS